MPKISVVVPIFDTERYLERCLDSILAQSLEDIEVICVDDLSPDNSYRIAETFAERDRRVHLLRHDRQLGLGGARNTAIRAARAPYLASVDSDDYVAPDMLERLWDESDGQSIDVVACGYEDVDEGGEVLYRFSPVARDVDLSNSANIFWMINPSFCTKLWRTTLFTGSDIWFPENCYYEDLATTPRILSQAKRMRVISEPLYKYLRRPDSITSRASERHIMDYFRCFEMLEDFLHARDFPKYQSSFLGHIGPHLEYHAQTMRGLNWPEAKKAQYLRHMVIMKLGFLEHNAYLRQLTQEQLVQLLRTCRSWNEAYQIEAPPAGAAR